MDAQKKGYLMRQNTKVVVASSRQFSDERPPMSPTSDARPSAARGARSAGNSPRKQSMERAQTWTTEPWNGKVRRKSVRTASGRKAPPSGPAPPLPGQESNASETHVYCAVLENQAKEIGIAALDQSLSTLSLMQFVECSRCHTATN